MNIKDKEKELSIIGREIEKCIECKKNKVGRMVFGEGCSDAEVMFVGEAPGRMESECGRPFIGRSGRLLRSLIRGIGLSEGEVYITSPVKYLPIHKTPNSEEIKHGMVHLRKQIRIVNPKVLVLLGRVAAEGVLKEKIQVSKMHGKFVKKKIEGRKVFITFHPAAGIRFQKYLKLFKDDFLALKKAL